MWIETCGNEVSIHVETESDISEAKHYIDTFDSTGDRYVTVVVDGEYMLFDASFPDTVFAIECENVHAVFRGGKHVEIHADNTFVKLFDSCTAETCDTGMYDDDSYAHVALYDCSQLVADKDSEHTVKLFATDYARVIAPFELKIIPCGGGVDPSRVIIEK